MPTYRKILVTGSSGLLGTGFQAIRHDYPDREFIFFGSRQCDLTKREDTLSFVEAHAPDAILHIAAKCGGVGLTIKHPAKVLHDNICMDLNIVEAARIHHVRKSVLTLSSGMYSNEAPNPLGEGEIHNGLPDESNYGYAFAKRLLEPTIRAYRAEYGMSVIGLVPNGIFGENGNHMVDESPMWAALVRRFYENRNNQEDIVIWGDGSPLREHTYSQDIARAFMWCLDNYDEEGILNIGSTEEYSVKEIAFMIAEIVGVDKRRIVFDTSKRAGIHRKTTDNSRFVELSGFEYTPFRVGLDHTIRWFCENYGQPGKVRLE